MYSPSSIQVSGTVKLSNGQTPAFHAYSEGILQAYDKPFTCHILGSTVLFNFPSGLKDNIEVDEIFRLSRHLVDTLLTAHILDEGIGLVFTLDYCKTSDGIIHQAQNDQAPSKGIEKIDTNKLYSILGKNADLRWALRDFNQGLINREDCPILFYRAVETAARAVLNLDQLSEVRKNEWMKFHKRVNTSFKDIEILYKISEKHRHGNRIFFTKDEHLEMMKGTKKILAKTAIYFIKLDMPKK